MPRDAKRIIVWLSTAVLVVLFFVMTGWFVRSLTYPAPFVTVPEVPPEPLKEAELKLRSGESVVGWNYDDPTSSVVLVYFHGNGENLGTMRQSGIFEQFIELQICFLAIDFPGYGRSSGNPSEAAITSAAAASLDWVRSKYPHHRHIVCGWSLGAAVAIQAASDQQRQIDGLIAMSAWSSLFDAAVLHFPRWMVRALLRESYDSLQTAGQIHCPALLIHGENDSLIPISQGKEVAQRISSSARWVSIPATGHNDLLSKQQVWDEIARFVKSVASS